ncbi:MAG: endonuclease III [Deltaproteobacteria bacterium]|nr:endonuclease III [Deltaproteobacteria bacterium]MBW1994328.1 endonuclease III [Deltaproteobacteria bacterium]
MSSLRSRADKIRQILRKTYPQVRTQLHHKNPFEILVATILSAQCTDKQVNAVTRGLFEELKTPQDFARVSLKRLESMIRPTGYYHNKAKNIKHCAEALLEKHDGKVPCRIEELVRLPGVGRKTANVVLGAAFGVPGIVVDTHVARIARRLEFTAQKDPVKIEHDLMEIIPKRSWNDFSLHLIYFGREYCRARDPKCPTCPINGHCRWPGKIVHSG